MTFSKDDTRALKGIAIIAMMFHHCFLSFSRFNGHSVDFFPLDATTSVDISAALKICVAIFAFISGYGLWLAYEKRQTSSGRWVFQRYIKTFGGYWLVFILSYIVLSCLNQYPDKRFFEGMDTTTGVVNIVLNFLGLDSFFGTPNLAGAWWYMGLALAIIAITPLVFHLASSIGIWPTTLIFILAPLLLCIPTPGGIKPLSFIGVAVLGMAMADLSKRKNLLVLGDRHVFTKIAAFLAGIAFVWLYFTLFRDLDLDTYWLLLYNILPIPVIWFCLKYLVRIPGVRQVLAFLGDHSMNIFLLHPFIRAVYAKTYLLTWGYAPVIVLVLILLTLLLSFAMEGFKKLIHWDKGMDYISRIGMRETKNATGAKNE